MAALLPSPSCSLRPSPDTPASAPGSERGQRAVSHVPRAADARAPPLQGPTASALGRGSGAPNPPRVRGQARRDLPSAGGPRSPGPLAHVRRGSRTGGRRGGGSRRGVGFPGAVAAVGPSEGREGDSTISSSNTNNSSTVSSSTISSSNSNSSSRGSDEWGTGVVTPPEDDRPDNWVSPVLLEAEEDYRTPVQKFLYPDKEELPDDVPMSVWDHLEELRGRVLVSVGVVGAAILLCFAFSKDLVSFLEAPVYSQGVRFLQLSPGEFFFTTLKVAGYSGLLLGSPLILYEIIAFVVPGLTLSERRFLGPIVASSSILFYAGIAFSYLVLTPAALNFFISYAEGVVESLWSIDQYFEFVLVLMFSTGISFQVPVIQLLLGQTGLVSSEQMLAVWKYVVVGAVTAAAILTPSTDPLTQCLLAGPLIGLYMGGAYMVKFIERGRSPTT